MAEVTDYQFAFINSLMYDQKSPEGPVSDFSIFEESEECESGFQGTLYTREDGVSLVCITYVPQIGFCDLDRFIAMRQWHRLIKSCRSGEVHIA